MSEILASVAIFWAFAFGLRESKLWLGMGDASFFALAGNGMYALAPVWVAMLFIGTAFCFFKENWIYAAYFTLAVIFSRSFQQQKNLLGYSSLLWSRRTYTGWSI